ncbi:MAG: hypothetical protein UMU75_09180 [Halomonas sp.]|nr:hypothetical protein [Halomonas sp.]
MESLTRTYEGRVPARPMIERGALWIPVAHHVEGVFENRQDTCTTVTFIHATGPLAEETLALAETYKSLRQQTQQAPCPQDYFVMHAIAALPSPLNEPFERAGWQFYRDGPTGELYASQPPEQSRIAFFRLAPKDDSATLQTALDAFERAIVNQGHKRIRLKEVDAAMRKNADLLKRHLADVSTPS